MCMRASVRACVRVFVPNVDEISLVDSEQIGCDRRTDKYASDSVRVPFLLLRNAVYFLVTILQGNQYFANIITPCFIMNSQNTLRKDHDESLLPGVQ
ncbi:hypothetical protein EVAR_56029_1 [Eumeta japonica]|uniref:Uncharacterized protein n=1 Tax=Eumeta variegata TaxID=151549 RepID=A0A4C1YP36_EUMVA|nr:hypothetical protein EVAR_56029_1 [Eumeta japonica]